MRQVLVLTLAVVGVAQLAAAGTPKDWAKRSIYQVITDRFAVTDGSIDAPCTPDRYCGGTWEGLTKKLDYIQDMGFTAVQISPVSKNLPQYTKYGDAFHGYWIQDLYTLNSHFGDTDSLKALSDELHKRDMYLMVDVVLNNMAYALPHNGSMPLPIDYSILNPFDNEDFYHPYCNISEWTNKTEYQNCWLDPEVVALPDLKTESPTVITQLEKWTKGLISNFSVDGLRIDGAKQIDDAFFGQFDNSIGIYAMGEVYDGDAGELCPYQEILNGLENYALYQPIIDAFTAGEMPSLVTAIKQVAQECKDLTTMATFIENQDQTRFASFSKDLALAKNAIAFTVLADGIPKMYYGQEQHLEGNYSPYSRQEIWTTGYNSKAPLYTLTSTVNKIRNHAIAVDDRYVTNTSSIIHTDGSTLATCKGPNGVQIVSVFSNQGTEGGNYTLNLGDGFDPGTEVMEVLSCEKATANDHGNITVLMGAGEPRVYFPTAQMNGSGLCGFEARTTTQSNSASGNSNSSSNSTNDSGSERTYGQDRSYLMSVGFGMVVMCVVFFLA